jgi:uracil phosphoribosyltransferase
VIFIDPMIATGGSACLTINRLIESGALEENIVVVGVIGATEGIERLRTEFPKINIVISEIDLELNETKFIVPGLGDFGDRFYGTPVGKSGLVK